MLSRRGVLNSPHLWPLLILCGVAFAYWSKVLVTGQVLLPGAFLRGFAPFGSDPQAPWHILQWDALGQYYPWRTLGARQLHAGLIPLWNEHQFAGTPLLANAQSAVFYPLNLPFWLCDVAYAFGISALLHTLLASCGTYFLAQRWKLSRAASLLAAIGFGFCGYLASWVMLPTLANTASWLPLLLLLFERASEPNAAISDTPTPPSSRSLGAMLLLAVALCCALLAGHPQVFIYLGFALVLRLLFVPRRGRATLVLARSLFMAAALAAIQILPTLELARLGHRAAQGGATMAGWAFLQERALRWDELPSLVVPYWPMDWGSLSENFGYIGFVVALLAVAGVIGTCSLRSEQPLDSPRIFAIVLMLFGLLYALGTPLARLFYFTVPGLAQMGGVGRCLLLWSLGAALLAGYGLDWLRSKSKSDIVPLLALLLVAGELFATGWTLQPIAPRASIYPATTLTDWLRTHTADGARILFLTPRNGWKPSDLPGVRQPHPPGVLPPNGAAVYGLNDVNGYDSLAPLAYRNFVVQCEGADVSPLLNANMILLENLRSPALDALDVRYVVSNAAIEVPDAQRVFEADGCIVYERNAAALNRAHTSGRDFYPGWHHEDGRPANEQVYEPQSFRIGTFISLCALGSVVLLSTLALSQKTARRTPRDT
jgi:hypothetical protein